MSPGVCDCARQDGEFSYMAAVEVGDTACRSGLVAKTVPEATYAVFTHHGPLDALGATNATIYGTWLPASPYEVTETPDLERYGERFNGWAEGCEMEIYVPIRPRALGN